MLDDFRLNVFLCVAETGSFTNAAKKLNVSQPAVSQNITTLETLLGIQLFERLKGSVVLTPKGRIFKEYAEKILYWYKSADMLFSSRKPEKINILSDLFSADYVLPNTLASISVTSSNISFDIRISDLFNENCLNDNNLSGYYSDIEIYTCPSSQNINFNEDESLIGVISPYFVVSKNKDQLKSITDIDSSYRLAVWNRYQKFLSPDMNSKVCAISPSINTIKTLVEKDENIVGIIPSLTVKKEIMEGSLFRMAIERPEMNFDVYLRSRGEFKTNPLYLLILNTLKEKIKE